MTDPYQVLGVSRSASDEEIKKKYRSLSRRYHPDANVNNPNKDQAEEMFKRVQQAYDQIMKERQQGYSSNGYGGSSAGGYGCGTGGSAGGFGNYGDFGSWRTDRSAEQESPRMQAAANYIRSHHYAEALHVLNDMAVSERQARWYYYSAVANQGAGNNATAMEHIGRAVELEPSNTQYRQYQQYLAYGGTWYTNMSGSYDRPYSGYSSPCLTLFLEMMLCSCCC